MSRLALVLLALTSLTACQSGAANGASCTRASECASGTCEFGRCRNECRVNRDCPSGTSCLLDASGTGACGLDVDLGCESGVGRECPTGLVCVADRCERECSRASECPMDGECRATSGGAMFCFDARGEPDAGPSDAGAGDAGDDAGQSSCAIESMCFERMGAACALDCQGRVWCWGQQHGNALGNGHPEDGVVTTPTLVVDEAGHPLVDVDSLACADGFACAHVGTSDSVHARHVLCWGSDLAGSFDSTPHSSAVDLQTPIVGDALQVEATWSHACVLDPASGAILCFGRNDGLIDPAMPDDTLFTTPTAPTEAPAGATQLGVGSYGACALLGASGEVRCWGENDWGQAGHTPIEEHPGVAEPNVGQTVIEGSPGVAFTGVTQLAVGFSQRAVLAHAGASGPLTLYTWGGNERAQLGDVPSWSGSPCDDVLAVADICRSRPATPLSAPAFASIASNGSAATTCGVIAASRHVLCWGDNLHAHSGVPGGGIGWISEGLEVLVDGTTTPLDEVSKVFVGAGNGCAIRMDGTLWCWGPNQDAQLARTPDALEHLALPIAIPSL